MKRIWVVGQTFTSMVTPNYCFACIFTRTTLRSWWHARLSHSIREPPCCAIGRFNSRLERITGEAGYRKRVSVARSHGPAKSAFSRYRQGKLVKNIKITIMCWAYIPQSQKTFPKSNIARLVRSMTLSILQKNAIGSLEGVSGKGPSFAIFSYNITIVALPYHRDQLSLAFLHRIVDAKERCQWFEFVQSILGSIQKRVWQSHVPLLDWFGQTAPGDTIAQLQDPFRSTIARWDLVLRSIFQFLDGRPCFELPANHWRLFRKRRGRDAVWKWSKVLDLWCR